jgi:ABC-type multidrug transport system fused ATPase/permease subunit
MIKILINNDLYTVSAGAQCAKLMFRVMAQRVLRAPMSFFQTTPMGRIVNRFTYDVEVMDVELSVAMTGLMMSSSWLLSSIVVMVRRRCVCACALSAVTQSPLQTVVLPWILIPLAPVTIFYVYTQSYYRMSGPDLQRLDAISRSPIQASLAEGRTQYMRKSTVTRFISSFVKLSLQV